MNSRTNWEETMSWTVQAKAYLQRDEGLARWAKPLPLVPMPSRPRVEEPAAWSCAVQDLLARACRRAAQTMQDELYLGLAPDLKRLHLDILFSDCLFENLIVRREFYDRVLLCIDQVSPDEPSAKGLDIDRAEAQLWAWQTIADRYVRYVY